jgi:hypothetical protein
LDLEHTECLSYRILAFLQDYLELLKEMLCYQNKNKIS